MSRFDFFKFLRPANLNKDHLKALTGAASVPHPF
jgi:hypothetical protein